MIKYYIVIGIIYMIPYMVMIGISCLKDKLETDRNFYGKDVDPKEIKLINVSYEKLNFVLISTQIKEIQYFYPILRLEYMQYISVLCNWLTHWE